jgi:flagellar motility protein MotE (MotC chaperone)
VTFRPASGLCVLMCALLATPLSAGAQQPPRATPPAAASPQQVLPTPDNVQIDTQRRQFSEMEIKLLQELELRRVELERREQALNIRERLVDLAEARLTNRVTRLETLQTNLERLLKNLSDKEEAELEQLARIYQAMKPAAAATVLDNLDDRIVFDLFKRMKNQNTAKILERMNPVKARKISEMMAEKSELPQF